MNEIIVNGKRIAKLLCVSENNNNKYYDMQELQNGIFKATWGRVDSTAASQTYPMNKWKTKYNEKIKKGYEDKTSLFLEADVNTTDGSKIIYSDISDEANKFIELLQQYANEIIRSNYKVSIGQVTVSQVEEAQKLIDELVNYTAIRPFLYQDFNKILLSIYKTIPRAMSNVRNFILTKDTTKDDMNRLVTHEQDLLDTLRGQMQTVNKTSDNDNNKRSDLLRDIFGLILEPVNDSDVEIIKKMLGSNAHQFKRAFKVTNDITEQKSKNWYDNIKKNYEKNKNWNNSKLFWHGSRNENWWSIMQNGLVLRPAKAIISGKMFGYGTYFADKAQKSINYTSLYGSYWAHGTSNTALLGLYEVYLGRVKNIKHHQSSYYNLDYDKLSKEGFDSVFAEGGADLINNEYIVYDENQTTIRYIIEITN